MKFRECGYFLTGERRGQVWLLRRRHPVGGTPSSVEIDWQQVLEREENHGDVLGFLHTHPQYAGTTPSLRDIRTMQAWCSALGKPLLCVIECYGDIGSTLFPDENDTGQPLVMTEFFPRGVVVVVEQVGNKGKTDDDQST